MNQHDRPRVSAAVFRAKEQFVLMVQHKRFDETTYWQLPGGGVMDGETLEDAVLRELHEETGLYGTIERKLFTIPYKYGISTTFLVIVDDQMEPVLGVDPEEANLVHLKLIGVAWKEKAEMQTNPEIAALIRCFPLI